MEHLAPNYMRCGFVPEVKASNKTEREVLHLISTASVDRAGDIVRPSGANVENYMKNPVVLRNHSYATEDIIGRSVALEITEDGIFARTKFRDSEVGQDAFNLASERLGGWSIGFRPEKYESIKDAKGQHKGFDFQQWELLEYSQVPIPMNQDAVNNAIKRGLVHEANVSLFFDTEPDTDPPSDEARQDATAGDDLAIRGIYDHLFAAVTRVDVARAARRARLRYRAQGNKI